MSKQTRKMSEILKGMAGQLLKNPGAAPSSEAAHVALMFANFAWNETVGLGPGIDVKWETRLYGLVRTGDREQATQFLRETRGMSRRDAERRVATVAAELGIW